jgi:cyclic-di-GMP phosphodiesterase TipF (flagellum assembly factor)
MVPNIIYLVVPLALGFVFAAPRAVRSEVLVAPSAPDAPAADPVARPDEPPPEPPETPPPSRERLPFRSFLRRAG